MACRADVKPLMVGSGAVSDGGPVVCSGWRGGEGDFAMFKGIVALGGRAVGCEGPAGCAKGGGESCGGEPYAEVVREC